MQAPFFQTGLSLCPNKFPGIQAFNPIVLAIALKEFFLAGFKFFPVGFKFFQ